MVNYALYQPKVQRGKNRKEKKVDDIRVGLFYTVVIDGRGPKQ